MMLPSARHSFEQKPALRGLFRVREACRGLMRRSLWVERASADDPAIAEIA
jgi:hypothetical protein